VHSIACPELANSTAWGLFLVFVFLLLFAMQYFLVVVNVQKGIFSTCHTCRDHCQLQEQHDDLLDHTAMHRLLLMMADVKLAPVPYRTALFSMSFSFSFSVCCGEFIVVLLPHRLIADLFFAAMD